jgi:hypothetical protein
LGSVFAARAGARLGQRHEHAAAIAAIDQVLEQIGQLLGQPAAKQETAAPPTAQVMKPAKVAKGRRIRGSYATTAEESILALVKQKGTPTTQDIKKLWASEGRRGTADNVLSHLVKDKKLKRLKLVGLRGSRYSLA